MHTRAAARNKAGARGAANCDANALCSARHSRDIGRAPRGGPPCCRSGRRGIVVKLLKISLFLFFLGGFLTSFGVGYIFLGVPGRGRALKVRARSPTVKKHAGGGEGSHEVRPGRRSAGFGREGPVWGRDACAKWEN